MLEQVIATGNRGHFGDFRPGYITCADGFIVSVIAGGGTYCVPRPVLCYHGEAYEMVHEPDGVLTQMPHDYHGPYSHVEVGFPSERPEPWDQWSQYAEEGHEATETVYGFVPVEMVRRLVADHGGEVTTEADPAESATTNPDDHLEAGRLPRL